jgi:phosphohistidine phosphatase SixA
MRQILISKLLTIFCLLSIAGQAGAQGLAGMELVEALRQGGLVLVMRHTSSPRVIPDAAAVNPDNINGERQLDEQGRRDAAAIGDAIRRLQIPIGEVLSSPAYRALETARFAGFDDVVAQEELSSDGMERASAQYAEYLQAQAGYSPEMGNRLFITHGPNISAAFAEAAEGMEEGDTLVIDPAGNDGPTVVARITSAEWSAL